MKKVTKNFKSAISFWSDANQITSNYDEEQILSEFSFTSAEFVDNVEYNKPTHIKFIIRDIEKYEDRTILIGDDVICNIYGEWREINFEKNIKITVTKCLCCEKELLKNTDSDYIYINITDDHHWLFIEDDLMTITNLISAIRCINNPFINTKIADILFEFNDKCLVNGIILHEIMEECMLKENYTLPFIMIKINESIKKNLLNIYICETNEKNVRNDLISLIQNIKSFERHNIVFDDFEKRIVSLSMNLKGNLDAIGKNTVLEIKSGKSMDVSHKAQVILYSLMMKEKFQKYFQPYLYYITSKNLVKVELKHDEIKSLMILRNKLTNISGILDCSCYELKICKIIKKILSLRSDHFLKKMWNAIEKEENYRIKETWHHVKLKKQLDTLVIFRYDDKITNIEDMFINIYSEDFVKLCKGIINKIDNTFLHVALSEKIKLENGEYYYISFGASDLFFKYMRYSLVQLAFFRYVEKNKKGGFKLPNEDNGLIFENEVQEISDDLCDFSSFDDEMEEENFCKRFKNESTSKIINQENISSPIFFQIENDKNNDKNLKFSQSSIENNSTPTNILDKQINFCLEEKSFSSFDYFTPPQPSPTKYEHSIPNIYMPYFLKLNDDQKTALYSALNCENYKIIHGMPGTGKSSVIILLIKILIHLNKKILLVCYTNLAITNILDKLKTVRAYRACKENINFYSVKEIETYFKNIDLVASTCFGFKDPIFIKREFDFCIIDEGSQQHLLLTLIPISLCKKFVIFGDHLQLKPLVKASKELNTSLFEYLLDDNHSKLCIQYRMGANIMKLSNTLFYDGLLQSGIHYDDEVIFIDSKTIDHEAFIKKVKNTTILCYLNSQVKKNKELTNCQVETIDRFQGSESDNVIVIFDPVIKCDVYESKERLNVALTRAKKSLILLGDKEAMYEIEILRQLLSLLNI